MEEQAGRSTIAYRNQRHHHGVRLPTAAAVNWPATWWWSSATGALFPSKPLPDCCLALPCCLQQPLPAGGSCDPSMPAIGGQGAGRAAQLAWHRACFAVGGARYALRNPGPTCWADFWAGPIILAGRPEQGPAGAAAAGKLAGTTPPCMLSAPMTGAGPTCRCCCPNRKHPSSRP